MRAERDPRRWRDRVPGVRVQAVCPVCLRILDTAEVPAVCPLCGCTLDHRARPGPQRRSPALPREHGRLRRLEELPPGTRVRLAPGRVGTLLEVNFTRAIVELDCGDDQRREVAPGCEVEVVVPDCPGRSQTGPMETSQTGPEIPSGAATEPAGGRNEIPLGVQAGVPSCDEIRCLVCGGPVTRMEGAGRPASFCSPACRQRAYRQRQQAPSGEL